MTAHASHAIIPFPQDRVRKPVAAERVAAMAEVLIFTGVQVERLERGTVSTQPPKPRRTARKGREGF